MADLNAVIVLAAGEPIEVPLSLYDMHRLIVGAAGAELVLMELRDVNGSSHWINPNHVVRLHEATAA